MTLDPKKGERAVVIKNDNGDWGILVARWDGFRKGIPGKRGNLKIACTVQSQGSHRLEKYLNLEFFLEKSFKIKSALKSTGKSIKGLEKSLSSSIFCRT